MVARGKLKSIECVGSNCRRCLSTLSSKQRRLHTAGIYNPCNRSPLDSRDTGTGGLSSIESSLVLLGEIHE